ncbi:LysR family substrate-binding domain-containing protein [Microbacterium sp. 179-B 1A2 NHS]|uniref:LysR family substrate-binding domain-containing protein n=1 Tax=Microbacterium sp. 179-B 1A2 NHS TaxID=3142383 RepID=UPI00399EF4DD
MAARGGPQRKGARAKPATKRSAGGASKPPPRSRPQQAGQPVEPMPAGPFRLGTVPGTTPGKWIDTWKQRMPRVPLELVPLEVAGQRDALRQDDVDAAIVRLPLDRDGLHVIPLYDEVPVVVCAADSHLTAADELAIADLAGEALLVPRDDVLHLTVAGTEPSRFDPVDTTGEAIATVASGVGIVIVPMSLARLHHRRDVEYRPLVDAPVSPVALAWPVDAATDLIDVFVGIVRGRTANSSRG